MVNSSNHWPLDSIWIRTGLTFPTKLPAIRSSAKPGLGRFGLDQAMKWINVSILFGMKGHRTSMIFVIFRSKGSVRYKM